ncbi:MAG TPA: hypothetical protein PLL80_02650 [Candidatus Pacearchaeota archaeon]|nr:hypothetical protein [Candidatus Pacearchaeota archaeon]HOK94409.1 hypothetical protein [Candidatus Pacearchaeota archaeon]HPO75482.1 hypothetical protein [Candidatus Pacearchaeota archaeon]
MQELEVLFGSKARPRILKLFFQNEGIFFTPKEVAKRCQISQESARKELEKLSKINLFQQKTSQKGPSKERFYSLNPKFPYLAELRALVLTMPAFSFKELTSLFKKERNLKLVVLTGIFLKENRSPVDLLIVSQKPRSSKISKLVKKIESQVGKEIKWSLMNVEEFNYRLEINDRFLKDIFDHNHKKIIDKI